jgi:Flp pilus assembly protein TadG
MMMRRRQSRRGQVLVLFAVMLPILLGFVALSVDVVYAFVVKAALVTALDSAALAGSRAIANGPDAVAVVVDRAFHANLPDGHLIQGAASYTPNPPVVILEADGTRSISLVAEARSPTFFLNVFGYSGWPVKAYAKAGRRDVNVMLVLDRSGSLVAADAWDDLQAAASFFVQQFSDTYDKVGLVSFGTNGRVEYAPQTSFKTPLVNLINNMQAREGNFTNSALGIYLAYNELRSLNDPTRENVIVYFTDGLSTALPGNFDVRVSSPPPSPLTCRDPEVEGVFYTGRYGGSVYGIFTLQPTAPLGTWPDPDREILSPGLCNQSSGGSNGIKLLNPARFRDRWIPSIGPATTVMVTGINPVDLGNINNGNNLINMAENMLVNVAEIARQDPLRIRVMAIGLSDPADPASIDEDVLRRVSNVPPYSASGQPVGLYVPASDQTGLQNAFRQVASAISHLIQ